MTLSETENPDEADLFLHLGAESPPGCMHQEGLALGCNILKEDEHGYSAAIYTSAPHDYFHQVIRHELLHALLPMGHLPEGNYLMSVRPEDPTRTHDLTPWEEKLLALYVHPYLRESMTMEKFREYLVVEG